MVARSYHDDAELVELHEACSSTELGELRSEAKVALGADSNGTVYLANAGPWHGGT